MSHHSTPYSKRRCLETDRLNDRETRRHRPLDEKLAIPSPRNLAFLARSVAGSRASFLAPSETFFPFRDVLEDSKKKGFSVTATLPATAPPSDGGRGLFFEIRSSLRGGNPSIESLEE